MSDKIRVLLIDDVNDYISYPVLHADQLEILHIDSWTSAQHILSAQTASIDPDLILIDINFQEDQSAPRWKQAIGEPDFGDKKPTGLFIGLAFSGMLYQHGFPCIGSIYSADPSLFRSDPATRTTAALLDMLINRSTKLWTQLTIDNWFDSFNLGSDPHHACKAALIKLRAKIVEWCQGDLKSRLAVTPASHWRVEQALKNISLATTSSSPINLIEAELTLEFITILGTTRRLNICSLFAEMDITRTITSALEFLQSISYFPELLKESVKYAERVEQSTRLTAIVPDTRPMERIVVLIILLLKWWKQRPEQWQQELNYAWDLDNSCPSFKPATSLKSYLKRLANALTEFNSIDLADIPNTAQYIEAFLLSKSSQYASFDRRVISDLLPMLVKAGCLKPRTDKYWCVIDNKSIRDDKIEHWQPDFSGIKFRQQEFLDSLQMQTNQFQRIIQDANKECSLSLPIYWENYWKGNGDFQLPCFLRVILQDYVKEYLNWRIEPEWPSWLKEKN
jgi:hypothetical protein